MLLPFDFCRRRGAAFLLFVACCVAVRAASEERPNIVFILIDDLRWDALGCTGHPFVKTPGIDRIAREGALFRNGFVTTPLCFPSRASVLTGQYAHRHGIKLAPDRARLGHKLVTFPLLLQKAGYATGFFGKWHLANEHVSPPGIERWVSFREQGDFVNPELLIDGARVKTTGYLTDLLTDHAVEFIRRPHPKPFLLFLSHKAVHAPWMPAERHKHLFADIPIRRAPSAGDSWEDKPILRRPGVNLNPNDTDVHTTDDNIRDQMRCLLAVDEGVQRIFAALEETKRLENTLIVFTSDNGYFWGEHQLGGKHGAYEESIRVPLIMRHPRLAKAGAVLDALALNIDLAPTLLDVARVRPPSEMQGRSLLPILRGDMRDVRSSFLAEFFLGNGTPRFPTWQAVRNARWKFIRYPGLDGMNELYDLQADPLERRNLIRKAPDSARTMEAELDRLLQENKA
jgi:N-acetylglucosamine-6-sulfatase